MQCQYCGKTRNVTYHPKVNMAICKEYEDVLVTILSVCLKPVNLTRIKGAVKLYHGHVEELSK